MDEKGWSWAARTVGKLLGISATLLAALVALQAIGGFLEKCGEALGKGWSWSAD